VAGSFQRGGGSYLDEPFFSLSGLGWKLWGLAFGLLAVVVGVYVWFEVVGCCGVFVNWGVVVEKEEKEVDGGGWSGVYICGEV
jgi:hypothetical protein